MAIQRRNAARRRRNSALKLEELEPRLLLSADAAGLFTPDTYTANQPVTDILLDDNLEPINLAPKPAQTEDERLELVFVDTDTPDYQQLVDDLLTERNDGRLIQVIVLDNERDGIEQITRTVQDYQGIDAIHLISHGDEGVIDLGNTRLSSDTLPEHRDELRSWGQFLDTDADILIYGCNLAGSADGQFLVDILANLTGADIAASDDLTGSPLLNGDWKFEYTVGKLETQLAFSLDAQANWSGLLSVVNVTQELDVVNGTVTSVLGLIGNPGGDGISLREAILATNADSGVADTINISAGTYTLTLDGVGEDLAATGDLDITDDLTIIGAGLGTTTVQAGTTSVNGIDRVFDIGMGVTAAFSDMTIRHGNVATLLGGGFDNAGDLTLENVSIADNTAKTGGGIYNTSTSSLAVTGGSIAGNSADDGGGIWIKDSSSGVTLTDVTVSGNSVTKLGGGISSETSPLVIDNSTFDANTAKEGGAIYNKGGALSQALTNVTLSGNSATDKGGAVMNSSGELYLTNVTVTANNSVIGSGILQSGGTVTTVNTIVAANTGSADVSGTFASLGYNLIGSTGASSGWVGNDLQNISPTLGALADNGGPTLTHDLLIGSRGIDEGTNTGAPATDQRGIARDATADIGALEYVAVNDAPVLAGANDLTGINENSVTNNGTAVSALISGHITDPDAAPLSGIAVVAVDDTNGTWQYSTNSGGTWLDFDPVTTATARLLTDNAATFVRFVPDTDWNGTVTNGLTFHAWDQTSGTAGATGDVSATTAYSTASASSSITVNAVNNIPVVTASGGNTTYSEQATALAIDSALTLVDADGNNGTDPSNAYTATIQITGNYTAADVLGFTDTVDIEGNLVGDTLTLSVIGGRTASVADFEAALRNVTFYNGSDIPSELDRTVSFTFNDGLADSNTTTKVVEVTALNDGPTITSTAGTTATEDTLYTYTATVTDPDDANNGTDLTWSLSGEPAGMVVSSTGVVTWTPAEGVTTSGAVTLTVSDGNEDGAVDATEVFTITVTPANTVIVTTATDNNDAGVVAGNASHTFDWLSTNQGADAKISLREAIIAANNTINDGAPDEIHFEILDALVGGTHTIAVDAAGLPVVDDPVIIDGTTDSDHVSSPIIVLDGASVTGDGLVLQSGSDGSTIRGLNIHSFGASGIEILGSDNNTVAGNYIGTDASGTAALANGLAGIQISGASNTIGGTAAADGNLISGNNFGIFLSGAGTNGNEVQGNLIGTDETGDAALGNVIAIAMRSSTSGNTIGGSAAGAGNVISGNTGVGIEITNAGSTGNVIAGNLIGTNSSGTAALANVGHAVRIHAGADSNTVGGSTASERNVIVAAAPNSAVVLAAADSNAVKGNYIGTDINGTAPLGAGHRGVWITTGSANNTVGGTNPGDRNVISAAASVGVYITGAGTDANQVQGNYVGTDYLGTSAMANFVGVQIDAGAENNVVGGTSAAARNIISGNSNRGVTIYGSGTSGNRLEGNYIGLDVTGTAGLGNSQAVRVHGGATGNYIGGTSAGAGNVISASYGAPANGVEIFNPGTSGNFVQGNLIGTNAAGNADLGNGWAGVSISDQASGNVIGGTSAAARNVLSGNNYGVQIYGNANNNTIQGNYIGTDITGTAAIGNGPGVLLQIGAYANLFGGTATGADNLIAFNTQDGITVLSDAGTGNTFLGNSIRDNNSIGIDLSNDGVTGNDTGDGDPGPNELLNYPDITSAVLSGTDLTLAGSIDTDLPDTTELRIEFFGNAAGTQDTTNGEGRYYLGTITVIADASGDATFSGETLSGVTLAAGDFVTATATRIDDPTKILTDELAAYGSTSEFAANVAITDPNIIPAVTASGGNTAYSEQATALAIDSAITLVDADGNNGTDPSNAYTATIQITGNYTAADVLGFVDTARIEGNLVGDTLTLSVIGGQTASIAEFEAALRSVTFYNGSDTPSELNRTVSFTFNDGLADSNTTTKVVEVTADNDPPVLNNNALTISEGAGFFLNASNISAIDPDTADASLTFTISNLTHGTFFNTDISGAVTSFTQADVLAGKIFFRHDGGEIAPGYDVSVSDGSLSDGPAAAAITFTNVNDAPVNQFTGLPQSVVSNTTQGATSVRAGDLDNDGDVDLVTTSFGDDRIVWYQNDGTGSFTLIDVATGVDGARETFLSDVNLDGNLDIVAVAYADQTVTWYENDGGATPTFAARSIAIGEGQAASVFAADFDNDTDIDIVVAYQDVDEVVWYENDGLSFTRRLIATGVNTVKSVTGGDIDGDGDIDIAAASFGDDEVIWYANNGAADPTFTPNIVASGITGAISLEVADIDGDGKLDLAAAAYASGEIVWFQNNGAPSPVFATHVVSTAAPGARDVAVADIDGDGDQDIISASFINDKFAWYESDGGATPVFTERFISQAGDGPRYVAVADIDGDGDQDVVGASYSDNEVSFFENPDGQMGPQSTAEDTPLVFSTGNGNRIWVSDSDAAGSEVKVRLEATNGTVSLNGLFGLTVDLGTGTADAIVEFRGNLVDINTALDGMSFTPADDFNGIASMRMITDDQGYTGTGSALTDDDTVNITVTPVNDPAAGLPTITGTATEDVTLAADTSGITDDDGLGTFSYQWQSSTDGGTIWNNVGTNSVNYTLGDADVGAVMRVQVSYTDGDGTPEGPLNSVQTATVANINDAPALTGANNLTGINENPVTNNGTAVSALISGQVTDPDTAPLAGIAVVAVDDTNGTWQYTTNSGGNWFDLAPVTAATARLLTDDASTFIRFVPDTDWNGTVTNGLTFHAWDQNSGTAGSTGDVSATTAYSTASASSSIAVGPVNNIPVVTASGGPTAYSEQAGAAVIDAAITLVDPDGANGTDPSNAYTATIQITANYTAADVLGFTDTAKIEGSLAGDTLTLSVITAQTASIAEFEAALQSVTFYNGSDTPSELDRTISFIFNDSVVNSNTANKVVQVTEVNDPLTGSVTIDGTVTQGQVLTANTTALGDLDGLNSFTYQWYRGATPIGTDSATYTLVQADVGANITVDVSYTDGTGHAESNTGGPVGPVANLNDAPTGLVLINNMSPSQGALLSASNTLADADGLGTITYQWFRGTNPVSIASGITYTTVVADVGETLRVEASYTDLGGTNEMVSSASTAPVSNTNDSPTGSVTITGTPTEDQVLTAANTLADADGLGVITYQWFRGVTPVGTGTTYTLGQADVGATMTVTASYTDGGGFAESVSSAGLGPVANVNDAPTGSVLIDNMSPSQGTLLSASNTLADEDGLGPITYQWFRGATAVGTGITYTTVAADVGQTLRVEASYTDGQGTPETVSSASTAPVSNTNDSPTGSVTISGTPAEDQVLTASNTLADADGLGPITYQWFRGATPVGTGTTYTLGQADVGATMTVTASYTDGGGTSESVSSAVVGPVANVNDLPSGIPTTSGTAQEGVTLSAGTVGINDEDGLGAFTYQWLRDNVAIGGATASTYTLASADVGGRISVQVRFTDGQGTPEGPLASAQTAVVTPLAPGNSAPTGSVVISGLPTEDEVLSVSNTLADDNGLGTISYQWLRNGLVVGGATGTSYTLTSADVGATMTVLASYTDGDGFSESVGSAGVGPIAAAAVPEPTPEEPPVEPPTEEPPVEPPTEEPPVEPPTEEPPVEPPTEQPPVEEPPVQPPVEPPADEPPVTAVAPVPPNDPVADPDDNTPPASEPVGDTPTTTPDKGSDTPDTATEIVVTEQIAETSTEDIRVGGSTRVGRAVEAEIAQGIPEAVLELIEATEDDGTPPIEPVRQPALTDGFKRTPITPLELQRMTGDAQVRVELAHVEAVLNNHALWTEIDAMKRQMSEPDKPAGEFVVEVVGNTGIGLMAGLVAYALRGGALLASLMSTMPLWSSYDPLPILTKKKKKPEEEDLPEEDTRKPGEIDALFE